MQKKLIIFIPSIEGGGVEKNLFIISNYLKIKLITFLLTISNKFKNKFNNKIKFISPKAEFLELNRKKKKIFCIFIFTFFEILKDRNF